MRRLALAAVLALAPAAASAHAAFGDLGPFYSNLLHPLADPSQGLILAAAGVLLARQPLAAVRPAYAALVLCGTLAVLLHAAVPVAPLGARAAALVAAGFGIAALVGLRPGRAGVTVLAGAAGLVAGCAIDLPAAFRAGALAALGGAGGIALVPLLAWGLVDLAHRRIGPVAGAVAGSWIAAVGIMAAVLPG